MLVGENFTTDGPISIEDATLIFKNFSGKAARYNPPGRRVVSILLDDNDALVLLDGGWKVRKLNPVEGEEDKWHLKCIVNYTTAKIAPKIFRINQNRRKILLTENSIGSLDISTIVGADVIVSPHHWKDDLAGTAGVSAYINTMYVRVHENVFELKYSEEEEDVEF